MHSCRSGHAHGHVVDVLLCQQDAIIDLLERDVRMTETTDQALADLKTGQDSLDAEVEALTAAEAKRHAFLLDLEANRGAGQLAPEQQAELDDLKARQAAVTAALDAERAAAEADVEPAPVTQPVEGAGDGMATGAAPVVVGDSADGTMSGGPVESVHDATDAGEEPASNET